MSYGAVGGGLSAPPFDYEKDPLVTSSVKLNTDNLKKAVRWLVDCVQDQQLTLARHACRLDEGAFPATRPGTQAGKRNMGKSMVSILGGEPLNGENGDDQGDLSITDGFNNALQGELLDMKINAMNRSLKAELPRMSDLDSERAKMMADVTSLQRDLTKRFQEADKKIHAELATSTQKLFEQLSRISTDVLSRIEVLEDRVTSNTDSMAAMKGSATTGSVTAEYKSASPSGSSKRPITPVVARDESSGVAASSSIPEAGQTTDAPAKEEPAAEARSGLLLPGSQADEEPPSPGLMATGLSSAANTASRPGTRGTDGEGSITSTNDSRKPVWKPTVRAESEPQPEIPDALNSWTEVQDTLATISKAQRQALEEARADLNDMGEALQAESRERLRVLDELNALREAQMSAEDTVNDLKTECDALREGQTNTEGVVNDLQSGMLALQDSMSSVNVALANFPSTARDIETLAPSAASEAPSEAPLSRPASQQLSRPPSQANQQASDDELPTLAPVGPGIMDLLNGKVKKVTAGVVSRGVQDESTAKVQGAFMEHATAWRDENSSSATNVATQPAVPFNPTSDARPMHRTSGAIAPYDDAGAARATDAMNRLQSRLSTLEGTLPEMEDRTNARAAALEQKFNDLLQSSGSAAPVSPVAVSPTFGSAPPSLAVAGPDAAAIASDAEKAVKSLQPQLWKLEERLQAIESRPAQAMERRPYSPQAVAPKPRSSPQEQAAPAQDGVVEAAPAAAAAPDMTDLEEHLAASAEENFARIRSELEEMLTSSQNAMRGQFSELMIDVQGLESDMEKFGGRTDQILTRLSEVEVKAAAAADATQGVSGTFAGGAEMQIAETASRASSALGASRPGSSQIALPKLPDLDLALDKHPADLSHLLDPHSGGQTPLPFVSRRGLQLAIEGLTDNFRIWLDAVYQSIITALQKKADSGEVEFIARQVQEAAATASDSVASFAKRALGGRCASCDNPLADEAMQWRRPAPSSSAGRWYPKVCTASTLGAQQSVRPPLGSSMSVPRGTPALPACGASRLPKLSDLQRRTVEVSDTGHVCRDFPKGKVLKTSASESQLRSMRQSHDGGGWPQNGFNASL